jgi:hypothetical protein
VDRRIVALLVLLIVAGSAAADQRHDSRLAEAAARIVAQNIGALRTDLRAKGQPRLFDNALQSAAANDGANGNGAPSLERPRPGEWRRGLARAIEAPRAVSPAL